MRGRVSLLLSILFIIIVFDACKKDKVGPELESFGNPPIVKAAFTRSRDTIKMPLKEIIYFNATFKNIVQWEINLTGEESGAHRRLTGVDSLINQRNSSWFGISDNPPAKFTNENVTAVLSFPNTPDFPTQTVTFYIYATGAFNNTASVLISDFSSTTFYGFPPEGVPLSTLKKRWVSEYSSIAPGLPVISNTEFNPAPDGNKYLFIKDSTEGAGNPFALYTQVNAPNRDDGVSTDLYFPLYVDPNRVYFNFYVYNTPTSDAWVKFQFVEADKSVREYNLKQPISNKTGWELVSVRYSDLELVGNATGKGNPDELSFIGIVLLSNKSDISKKQYVSVALDHMIFTFDQPYKP